ncbi:Hypothetical protein NTJ_00084 [Nesidiocoris tenuis]|uniref:Uncharacterized protein n=1 Tax=Nesidiocoris tenuis TaxID=355587 RepID=A0ABN7A533_9HEMI|nr:Hypothetical protein NTJ_00084 [Nesidiocoris tenuis]
MPEKCKTIERFFDTLLVEYKKPLKMKLKTNQPVEVEPPSPDLLSNFEKLSLGDGTERSDEVDTGEANISADRLQDQSRPEVTDVSSRTEDEALLLSDDVENAPISFDLGRMVPKGPTYMLPTNFRSKTQPYPQQQVNRINDHRQMMGGEVFETDYSSYWTPNITCSSHEIPTTVAELNDPLVAQNRNHYSHSNLNVPRRTSNGEDALEHVFSNEEWSKMWDIILKNDPSSANITSPSTSDVSASSWVESPINSSAEYSPESLVNGQQSPGSCDIWDEQYNNLYARRSSFEAVLTSPSGTENESSSDFMELHPRNIPTHAPVYPQDPINYLPHSSPRNIPHSVPYQSPYNIGPQRYHSQQYPHQDHQFQPAEHPNIPYVPAPHTIPFKIPMSPREGSRIPSPATSRMSGAASATTTKTTAQQNVYAQSPVVMNIPAVTSTFAPPSEERPFTRPEEKKRNTTKAQHHKKTPNSSPQVERKILPSSEGRLPSATTSLAHTHNVSPQQRLNQMLKPQRKATIWKVVGCIEPWDTFRSKNNDNQTNLMQLLLSDPKPKDFLERVFIITQRMINCKAADLLTCKDKHGHSALYQAATLHSDCPVVAAYIADSYARLGCDVNETYEDGNTLLHRLARFGEPYEDVFRELLHLTNDKRERLFNVNAQNKNQETPLHTVAAFHMNKNSTLGIADALIKRGADVSIVNAKGETALHVASKSDACEFNFIKKLLEIPRQAREAVNTPDENGNTPLHIVARSINVNNIRKMQNIMEQFLTSSADVNVRNLEGRVPLSYIHQECLEEFRILFQQRKQ